MESWLKMKPLRVLLLVAGFAVEGPLGGVERFGIELARALDKTQFTPILCGLWDFHTPFDKVWCERLNQEGLQAFLAAPKDDTSPYRNYRQVLQGILAATPQPVDIIHSHSEFGDVAALWLRRTLGAKAVMRTVHNEREWPKRPLRRLLLTNLLYPLRFDAELGVAQRVVANLDRRPLARLVGRQGQCMYNALNFARFSAIQVDKAAKRQSLGLPHDAIVIGSVGRLTQQKGYHVLLEAVPAVLQQQPNAYFVIIGTGEHAAALQQQAQTLGITDHVYFTGARSDVEELLSIMDLFVSSSLWEGLPTVILESMAAGVPVLATRVSGSSELVNDGLTGLLVPPGDAAALAMRIIELLNDPNKAKQMSAHAQHFALTHFSIQTIAQAHAQLYQKLVPTNRQVK